MDYTREEWLKKCKLEALKQYAYDLSGLEYSQPFKAIPNAIVSMMADLTRHPETTILSEAAVFLALSVRDEESLIAFINGFN